MTTNRRVARLGMAPWSPDLLFRPGVNVRLGVTHFAPLLARLGGVERALLQRRRVARGL